MRRLPYLPMLLLSLLLARPAAAAPNYPKQRSETLIHFQRGSALAAGHNMSADEACVEVAPERSLFCYEGYSFTVALSYLNVIKQGGQPPAAVEDLAPLWTLSPQPARDVWLTAFGMAAYQMGVDPRQVAPFFRSPPLAEHIYDGWGFMLANANGAYSAENECATRFSTDPERRSCIFGAGRANFFKPSLSPFARPDSRYAIDFASGELFAQTFTRDDVLFGFPEPRSINVVDASSRLIREFWIFNHPWLPLPDTTMLKLTKCLSENHLTMCRPPEETAL